AQGHSVPPRRGSPAWRAIRRTHPRTGPPALPAEFSWIAPFQRRLWCADSARLSRACGRTAIGRRLAGLRGRLHRTRRPGGDDDFQLSVGRVTQPYLPLRLVTTLSCAALCHRSCLRCWTALVRVG